MTPRDLPILYAEDDPDDQLLARLALLRAGLTNPIVFVGDGEEALAYLRREGRYSMPGAAPRPGLVLVDLNMPGLGGHETVRTIKSDPALRRIPVVVLTTSEDPGDIERSYEAGANSYIIKPPSFATLVSKFDQLGRYWFDVVALAREGM